MEEGVGWLGWIGVGGCGSLDSRYIVLDSKRVVSPTR